MPRHPRIHASGLLYHLMARGNNGQPTFLDQTDYDGFLTALQTTRGRYPFRLYAYVLMPNHVHLLVEVGATPTGKLMQALFTAYVRAFNRRHRRRGHLFQGRYKAIVCDRDSYLLELVRYIHLNPVRAGLVQRPGEWPGVGMVSTWAGTGEAYWIRGRCWSNWRAQRGTKHSSGEAWRGDTAQSGTQGRVRRS